MSENEAREFVQQGIDYFEKHAGSGEIGRWWLSQIKHVFNPGLLPDAAKAEPQAIDRVKLRGALLNVLCNASNYPTKVAPHILGHDMGPLVENAMAAILALSAQEAATEGMAGQIVTASFEDGEERAPFCGLEDCECPDHEGPAVPAGTYVTVRLDSDVPVGLWRVQVVPADE